MKTIKYKDYLHSCKDDNWYTLEQIFGVEEGKYCINEDCENKLDKNDVFCKYCGMRYDENKKKMIPMSEEAQRQFAYSLYEVEFDCELDLETGNIMILAVNGEKLKEPVKG